MHQKHKEQVVKYGLSVATWFHGPNCSKKRSSGSCCDGNDGADAPDGPDGIDGPDGPDGTDGKFLVR